MAITLQRAVQGFNLHLAAEGRSTHTIRDYNTTLTRFLEFAGPLTLLETITPDHVRRFLAYWSGKLVEPDGIAPRPPRVLSQKTILNMHTALSALWSWAVRESYAPEHIIAGRIKPPRASQPPIEPLTDDQIHALLDQAGSERNRALVLFMLDTGCRASEVCGLRLGDVDMKARSAMVTGKGNKRRLVAFGPKTARALFRYISRRDPDQDTGDSPVFQSRRGGALARGALLGIVRRAGERAGIRECYPHRLRHTFAINYLRYGGDIYTLQKQLGHESLDMVRRYLKLAGADVLRAHRRASPVENIL